MIWVENITEGLQIWTKKNKLLILKNYVLNLNNISDNVNLLNI